MITLLASVLAAPLTMMNALIIAELVAGCLPTRPVSLVVPTATRIAILIPAHDEEIDIASTVRATVACAPLARVIVIADNCTDATASQAHMAGAEVIIRNDLTAIGKGYALAFGRAHLEATAPDYVVMLDADTQVQPDAVDHLVRAAAYYQRAVQGSYWLECDTAASARVRISAAAFFLTNVIRMPGLDRLVKASVLTGSGIAVPWDQFMRLPLATGHIAEDLMLGIWLLEQGTPPRFAPLANVAGRASSNAGTGTQRDRWESGRNQVVADSAMGLLRQAFVARSLAQGWIALRLLTPPLSTLVFLNAALAMIAIFSFAVFGVAWVHPVQLVSFALLLLAVPSALTLHGRSDFTAALGNALPYTIWKLGRALVRRSKPLRHWQRTDRGR